MTDLDLARIEQELTTRGAAWGRPLALAPSTASTNDDAKAAARAGAPEGAAFLAETQSAGRGRLGRSWHSPAGENLYASWLLRPDLAAFSTPPLTLAAGLAVCDVLAPLVPAARVLVKWPNDVLVDGRKVAGVLCEAQMIGSRIESVVIGIGVNVHTRAFPPDLAGRATSLALAGATAIERGQLFVSLCLALHARVDAFQRQGLVALLPDLRRVDALAGHKVQIDGTSGIAQGIDEQGMIRIVGDDGVERTYGAGEVTVGTAQQA